MRKLTGSIRKIIQNNWGSIFISIIFVLVYVINEVIGHNVVFHALSGSGFKKLNGEVYRIITASFLHTNLLHLVANIIALISVCCYLERILGSGKMLMTYISADLIASMFFYGYMNECTGGNGSSIAIYALFAVLFVLWLRYPDEISIKWYHPALIYMVLYFFIASLITGSYMTIIIHAFSFLVGLLVGFIMIMNRKKNQVK